MPLLSSRQVSQTWAEGYWCGFVVGLVVMAIAALAGALAALWWVSL